MRAPINPETVLAANIIDGRIIITVDGPFMPIRIDITRSNREVCLEDGTIRRIGEGSFFYELYRLAVGKLYSEAVAIITEHLVGRQVAMTIACVKTAEREVRQGNRLFYQKEAITVYDIDLL